MAYIKLQAKRLMLTDLETKSAREMFEYRSNREVSRFLTFRPSSLEEVVGLAQPFRLSRRVDPAEGRRGRGSNPRAGLT